MVRDVAECPPRYAHSDAATPQTGPLHDQTPASDASSYGQVARNCEQASLPTRLSPYPLRLAAYQCPQNIRHGSNPCWITRSTHWSDVRCFIHMIFVRTFWPRAGGVRDPLEGVRAVQIQLHRAAGLKHPHLRALRTRPYLIPFALALITPELFHL